MHGRTIVLVSHHVQLCAPGASYIVALDNGRVQFQGDNTEFQTSGVMGSLVQSGRTDADNDKDDVEAAIADSDNKALAIDDMRPTSASSSTVAAVKPEQKKGPRKLVEEETRAVGRISRDIWQTYILACGGAWFWSAFIITLIFAAMSPVAENWWLK